MWTIKTQTSVIKITIRRLYGLYGFDQEISGLFFDQKNNFPFLRSVKNYQNQKRTTTKRKNDVRMLIRKKLFSCSKYFSLQFSPLSLCPNGTFSSNRDMKFGLDFHGDRICFYLRPETIGKITSKKVYEIGVLADMHNNFASFEFLRLFTVLSLVVASKHQKKNSFNLVII